LQSAIYEALRFANWAAGQGICPAEGEDATAPEDFLMAYSEATGDDDWETLPARIAVLEAQLAEAKAESARLRERLAEALKALEPFADAADYLEDDHKDTSSIWVCPAAIN